MSVVTNILVSTELEEDGQLIANWLSTNYGGDAMPDLSSISGATGGSRAVEANLRVGAYNYFEAKEFYSAIADMPLRGQVKIFLQKDHEDVLTLGLVLLPPLADRLCHLCGAPVAGGIRRSSGEMEWLCEEHLNQSGYGIAAIKRYGDEK